MGKCENCGEESGKRYCSKECYISFRELNNWLSREQKCIYCGGYFESETNERFCSKQCRLKAGDLRLIKRIKNPKVEIKVGRYLVRRDRKNRDGKYHLIGLDGKGLCRKWHKGNNYIKSAYKVIKSPGNMRPCRSCLNVARKGAVHGKV